ncbi:hypothetical protein R1flu_011297 [Riccia fluitans]|uniref:2Fe-2S ferredoxin n=1 Tax=Riccia fluitans TaxID=41844 RepID=A0ABD1Z7F1_9MARC
MLLQRLAKCCARSTKRTISRAWISGAFYLSTKDSNGSLIRSSSAALLEARVYGRSDKKGWETRRLPEKWQIHARPASGSLRSPFYCEQRCGISSGAKDYGDKETISVTFVDKDGDETEVRVPVGMSILEAAHENGVELEGACEGSLACSTCHVIVMDEEMYAKLPEPTDEENDMLDLAFGLTETSRLGCQVIAQKELAGLRLALPAATRNFAVDGHVPKPH